MPHYWRSAILITHNVKCNLMQPLYPGRSTSLHKVGVMASRSRASGRERKSEKRACWRAREGEREREREREKERERKKERERDGERG